MDPICAISVTRGPDGRYLIAWDERFSRDAVRVEASSAAQGGACDSVVAEAAYGRAEVSLPPGGGRWYFRLRPATGAALMVGERALPLAGGINFRDLGGYRAAGGRRLRWGRLYRSGHMANFTAGDKASFADLGIGTVCDFRLAEEREHEKTELPGAPALHILGIPPGVGDKQFFHRLFAGTRDPGDVVDAMHLMLACLVREAAPRYQRLFDVLLSAPPGALLMNCSAGKERTGVASALVLSALGVPRETIMYDFMLSQTCFPAASEVPRVREKYAVTTPGEVGTALIMPLLETRPSYLEAAFAAIDEDYGSTDAFLRAHYALEDADFARLRELYTE